MKNCRVSILSCDAGLRCGVSRLWVDIRVFNIFIQEFVQ